MFNPNEMSPRRRSEQTSPASERVLERLWTGFGIELREARRLRHWTVAELAGRAGLGRTAVYQLEAGSGGSADSAARVAVALSRRVELHLVDPRRADQRPSLAADVVHSVMGEFEAGHLRRLGFSVGIDEPYQHYQFAGRADVIAWSAERRALLHIENRTRFPDFQDMAGAFNSKRAYLGSVLAERLGLGAWRSETHVVAALWSSEILHAIRLRTESFRSLCPDPPRAFEAWWTGDAPAHGSVSSMVVLDPAPSPRQRPFIGLEAALVARPRYRGYADASQSQVAPGRRRDVGE